MSSKCCSLYDSFDSPLLPKNLLLIFCIPKTIISQSTVSMFNFKDIVLIVVYLRLLMLQQFVMEFILHLYGLIRWNERTSKNVFEKTFLPTFPATKIKRIIQVQKEKLCIFCECI